MVATTFPRIRTSFVLTTLALALLIAAVPPPSDSTDDSMVEASKADPRPSQPNPSQAPIPAAAPSDPGEVSHVTQPVVTQPVVTQPAVAPPVVVDPSRAGTGVAVSSEESRSSSDVVPSDYRAIRSRTIERLGKLPKPDDKNGKSSEKNLRDLLETRLKLIDAWENSAKERAAAENPEPSPEDEAADLKVELERIKTQIAAAADDLKTLIPPSFRNLPTIVAEPTRNEIKEAISAAELELKETTAKVEESRARTSTNTTNQSAARRADRDKQAQKIATLKGKIQEREKGLAEALNAEARKLALEKLVNANWEMMAETEKLKAIDALAKLGERRAKVAELSLRALEARVALASRTLLALKNLHRTISAREERTLQQAAVMEKSRADMVDDPLERYRAKRAAELLELQAAVIADENALTLDPPPTFDEQHNLAVHAATDLANVKHLLDDGRVSHLDALRLNNDFRRIGLERERIEKNELARSALRLANAENALSRVEIEIIYDGRDDRFEIDNLLERLPKPDHPKLIAMFEDFERRHTLLLARRQRALEKIARRAEETHDQILKRLRILDEHFGFIRTHIFWVRDEEPVSTSTFSQANREALLVAHTLLRLAAEFGDRSLWGRFSPEFVIASVGVVVLPWPLRRLNRRCRGLVEVKPNTSEPRVGSSHSQPEGSEG